MNDSRMAERDERTVAIENASYSISYKVAMFALLFDVAYRGFVKNEAAWDLLSIVIISGFVTAVYQARQNILTKSWVKAVMLASAIAAAIASIIAFLR